MTDPRREEAWAQFSKGQQVNIAYRAIWDKGYDAGSVDSLMGASAAITQVMTNPQRVRPLTPGGTRTDFLNDTQWASAIVLALALDLIEDKKEQS